MCACGTEVETTEHFLLRCHLYSTVRFEHFEKLEKIDPKFLNLNEKDQFNVLLYGYQINKPKSFNQSILSFMYVISYIKVTARFDKLLVSFKQ